MSYFQRVSYGASINVFLINLGFCLLFLFRYFYYSKLLPTAIMTMLTTEQNQVIFLYKYMLCHSANEALRKTKQSFDNDSIDIKTDQRWFQRFRWGNESLECEPRVWSKWVIRHEKLNVLVKWDPRWTVRKIWPQLLLYTGRKSEKSQGWIGILHFNLMKYKETDALQCFFILISRSEKEPFLYRSITCDKIKKKTEQDSDYMQETHKNTARNHHCTIARKKIVCMRN